jgi:TRAP-type mannitol/chloroaromatic compound transport system permease small subunit
MSAESPHPLPSPASAGKGRSGLPGHTESQEQSGPPGGIHRFIRAVDAINETLGWLAAAAALAACLISAGNAVVRYGFDVSSNAWLEIQWYLFACTVLLGAACVMRRNEHVRVDILYARLPPRGRVLLDLAGLALFVLPVIGLLAWLSWPVFWRALVSGETSNNAGGLVRWPALALLPLGFGLVFLQALAEIARRIDHLRHGTSLPQYERPVQ